MREMINRKNQFRPCAKSFVQIKTLCTGIIILLQMKKLKNREALNTHLSDSVPYD